MARGRLESAGKRLGAQRVPRVEHIVDIPPQHVYGREAEQTLRGCVP
jgi:hypothetical protein